MGVGGYFFSSRSVFIITALLLGPTLIALWQIRPAEVDPTRAHGGNKPPEHPEQNLLRLMLNGPLLAFAVCNVLFQLANAAMLPLMGSILTCAPQLGDNPHRRVYHCAAIDRRGAVRRGLDAAPTNGGAGRSC